MRLFNTIEMLIKERGIRRFMVGTNGSFDKMAYRALRILREKYPDITVTVVLAYIPEKPPEYPSYDAADTCIPEGIEHVPKRFCILHRNKWMITQSQIVVTYVRCGVGGAAKAEALARKKGKEILALAADEV